jgi:hypothetical protein
VKSKAKLLTLLSTPVFLGGGFAPLLILNQCSNKENDPSDYVGNDTGTNWKGYQGDSSITSNILTIDFDEEYTSASISSSYSYVADNLIIPKYISYEGKKIPLKGIDGYAFESCQTLTGSLTIPNSVTSIGGYAFHNCNNLTGNLIIPNSIVDIGQNSFAQCEGFTGNLVIGNSVQSIGDGAFYGCEGLRGSLTIGKHVTSIGEGAFWNCNSLTGNLIIPNSVTSISNYCFTNCFNFTKLSISNNVTSIGEGAFYGCRNLSGDLVIPNTMESIANYAFYGCNGLMGTYTADAGYPNNKISCDSDNVYYIKNNKTYYCLGKYNNVTSTTGVTPSGPLTLQPGTKIICDEAFILCEGLTGTLTIPSSVVYIGNSSFYGCLGFTSSLIIPDSVITINDGAFCNCSNIDGLFDVPSSVRKIGIGAFENCGFTIVNFPVINFLTIEERAFEGC